MCTRKRDYVIEKRGERESGRERKRKSDRGRGGTLSIAIKNGY